MAKHGITNPLDFVPPRSRFHDRGKFGRMFGSLPPFASDNPTVRAALIELGAPGGIMDAGDPPVDPKSLVGDLNHGARNEDNPRMTAGMTFLGQFLDHDMTFDPTSSLERQADPEHISNFRTPTLALDSLYGAGPDLSPYLYQRNNPAKFLIESGGLKHDLPRNCEMTALIGDPRNDENLIVSQLHLAMLKFHNTVVDRLAATGLEGAELFCEAQRQVRWHYQWIILHEFLPLTCGKTLVNNILDQGLKFYKWNNEPYIPVEFSVSAYRFGHSQVRPSYRANFTGNGGEPFFAMIFGNPGDDPKDPLDLRGGCRAPRRFVGWSTFFDFGNNAVKPNKKIDARLSSALFSLPGSVVPNPGKTNPASLAQRNLLRHLTFALPSGQRVAQAMKLEVLTPEELSELADLNLQHATPLWYYILKEADLKAGGLHLGPVGGTIVAEVIIGLIMGDKQSYLAQDPDWRPSLPRRQPEQPGQLFSMVDLLTLADPEVADMSTT